MSSTRLAIGGVSVGGVKLYEETFISTNRLGLLKNNKNKSGKLKKVNELFEGVRCLCFCLMQLDLQSLENDGTLSGTLS